MDNGYQAPEQAKNYSDFLESEDGKFQKHVVLEAVLGALKSAPAGCRTLDLGCGPGWLTHALTHRGYNLKACDASSAQIDLAKKHYPGLNFTVADPQISLPYQNGEFDAVVASLVICDMKNQPAGLKEIRRVLAPGGKFINIISNPYYTLPVMQWKRGFFGKIFGQKPKPRLLPYFSFMDNNKREFNWRGDLKRRFYPLAEQINNLISAGFKISFMDELQSQIDTAKFSRQYQLYRYPLYLLIECTK